MKKILTLFVLTAAGAIPASAQWAVVDVANIQQSALNYSALVQQISKQATQISNQIRQIEQFETQLRRMGDMSSVRNLAGFSEFRTVLELPTKMKKWADTITRIDGHGIFGDTRDGIFRQIAAQFPDFDGILVDRVAEIFKVPQSVIVAVDEFKNVQGDVYARRENLKRAIVLTSEAMQAATTEAEQQKLQAVIEAQYGQLAAVDAEVSLSAAEVQVKTAEAVAMNDAKHAAEAETRRRLSQQEVGKLSTTFKPRYECLLQYVTERRFSP